MTGTPELVPRQVASLRELERLQDLERRGVEGDAEWTGHGRSMREALLRFAAEQAVADAPQGDGPWGVSDDFMMRIVRSMADRERDVEQTIADISSWQEHTVTLGGLWALSPIQWLRKSVAPDMSLSFSRGAPCRLLAIETHAAYSNYLVVERGSSRLVSHRGDTGCRPSATDGMTHRHTELVKPSDWIAVAAVLVSAFAIGLSWLASRESAHAQERTTALALTMQTRLAADERLWHRRADLYVSLLDWSGQAVEPEVSTPPSEGNQSSGALREFLLRSEPLPPELDGQAKAFASDDVRTVLESVQETP